MGICQRCGRELTKDGARYGWRCAKRLGVETGEIDDRFYSEKEYVKKLLVSESKLKGLYALHPETSGKANTNYSSAPIANPSSIAALKSDTHNEIIDISKQYTVGNPPVWTTDKALWWQITDNDPDAPYIKDFKLSWISAYKDVIKDAAKKYDIPPLLLAGVAYVEVAGDPMWIDSAGFNVRSINEKLFGELFSGRLGNKAMKTSFGNISMQVVVGAETLGYDAKNLSDHQIFDTISSLKNPVQNIYISAKHLSTLRDVDFAGTSAAEMTNDQIAVTAERYNRGAGVGISDIKYGSNGYGSRIMRLKNDIMEALR